MADRYTTRYFEKYAALSLIHCCDAALSPYIMSESPDLQYPSLDMGCEVTRAVSAREGRAGRQANDYLNQGMDDAYIKEQMLRQYPNFEGEVYVIDDIAIVSPSMKNQTDFKIHIEKLHQSILTKTMKLNKNYKRFAHNHLYIFTFTSLMDETDIREILEQSNREIEMYEVKYDVYYINCIDALYTVDRISGIIERATLDDAVLDLLREEATLSVRE